MATRKTLKLNDTALWDFALRLLGKRAHSASEIKQKLLRRAANVSDVPAILAKLSEYGLADDRKFSEAFASSRLSNDGFGRARVLRDLRSKRVSSTVAENAVEKAFAGTSEERLIDQFLARKYRSKNLVDFLKDQKNLASAYRRLRTAGFSSSATVAALKRHSQAAVDWNEPPEEESPEEEL